MVVKALTLGTCTLLQQSRRVILERRRARELGARVEIAAPPNSALLEQNVQAQLSEGTAQRELGRRLLLLLCVPEQVGPGERRGRRDKALRVLGLWLARARELPRNGGPVHDV